jgi:hypothetical protein
VKGLFAGYIASQHSISCGIFVRLSLSIQMKRTGAVIVKVAFFCLFDPNLCLTSTFSLWRSAAIPFIILPVYAGSGKDIHEASTTFSRSHR